MADAMERARATQIQSLQTLTGKRLDELLDTVAAWGPGKHGDHLKRAKETFGLTHGHASFLVHLARERADATAGAVHAEPLDAIFAGAKASLRPRHRASRRSGRARCAATGSTSTRRTTSTRSCWRSCARRTRRRREGAGRMHMTWTFERDGDGTLVTVRAEDVPAGIRQEDHVAAMTASLAQLAGFVEAAGLVRARRWRATIGHPCQPPRRSTPSPRPSTSS